MNARKILATLTLTGALAAGFAVASSATDSTAAAARMRTPSAAPRSSTSDAPAAGPDRSSSTDPSTSKATQAVRALGHSGSGVTDTQLIHRPGEAVAGTDTGQWSSMYDFMQFVMQDTGAVWNWYYQQWGVGSSGVHYSFPGPGEAVQSACDASPQVLDDASPFYCGADDTIYMSQVRAQWYWQNAGGDFGVAAALAHEYGHNVQTELGISRSTYGPAKFEQHADCLSGAFTHVAYYQGILDANDVSEGLSSRALVGDYEFTSADHHGTPQERMTAWQLGYDAAGPAACDAVLNG